MPRLRNAGCAGSRTSGRRCGPLHPQLPRLLRARRERPRRRAAEQRDEIASPHSITSSASVRSLSGIWRPTALAVFKLMTNSNLVGCITGRSEGFAPCSIFPT